MHTRSDVIVNSICVALMLVTVGAHIWAIFHRYRLSIKHLDNPEIVRNNLTEITSVALTGIGLAVTLGISITLLLKK